MKLSSVALGSALIAMGCVSTPEAMDENLGTAEQALSTMTREDIIALAKTGVGYSYWWAHGRWRLDGAEHGSCSGYCPSSCSHSGSYGADCSGFVGKVWQVPNDIDVSTDAHPYSTWHFVSQQDHWGNISRAEAAAGDAFVYNTNGSGHIFLYESGDPWGSVWAYECAGCNTGCVHNIRTAYSNYTAIRRHGIGLPLIEQIVLPLAASFDGSTNTDVDGDGTADVCARHSMGFRCVKSGREAFGEGFDGIPPSCDADGNCTPELSNDLGWDKPEYYGTIRMADINGDGKADVCARGSGGVRCWLSNGSAFPDAIEGPGWTDEGSWNQMQYWSTIRLADIDGDGKADICARAAAGLICHRSTGTGFGEAILGPEMSDAFGWNQDRYYGTIRFADVDGDGKMDVCARHSMGFSCWISDGNGFPTRIEGPVMSNDYGWGDPKYWGTIRMADVDADGKADVCARHSTGSSCWLSDGTGLSTEIIGPDLGDAAGWGEIQYWSTIRLTDINGDKRADLCARGGHSFHCWLSKGTGFGGPINGPDMGDAQGWNKPEYYATFRVADATGNGSAEVCGRGSAGIVCWPFLGENFGEARVGPDWSDEHGWAALHYYGTVQLAGGCIARAESCNERDDDCDGAIDEDGICGGQGSGSGDADPAGADGDASEDGGCSMRSRPAPWSLWLLAAMAGIYRTRRRAR